MRIGLLVVAGVVLTGAALWAGSNGPWTGRPEGSRTLPSLTITPPTLTPPTLPTIAPRPPAAADGGSGFDPTIVLVVLGGILLVALLVMLASMMRNRSDGPAVKKRPRKDGPAIEPVPAVPDPARPFDTREAADYVIACWEQVEQRAAGRGKGRRREQTPTEFLETLRARYPMDERPGAELLALYQRARFDHVRLLPDTASRARVCADAVLAAIDNAWSAS